MQTMNYRPANLRLHVDDGWRDLSPDNVALVRTGGVVTGTRGLRFNGVDSYITAGDTNTLAWLNQTAVGSVCAWIRLNAVSGSLRIITSGGATASGVAFNWVASGSGAANTVQLYGLAVGAYAWRVAGAANSITDTLWHHVLVTFDAANRGRVFVDGSVIGTAVNTYTGVVAGAFDYAPKIGATGNPASTFSAGRVRGLRVWDVVISESEAKYIYDTESRWPDFRN